MSRSTPDPAALPWLCLRGFHPLWPGFPNPFRSPRLWLMQSLPRHARMAVWAPSLSLAATREIDVSFFSSGYLDVSVHRVPLHALSGLCSYSCMDTQGLPAWVPPFRHLRITVYLPLPAAFRSLSRLSSALSAKASALCPFSLDHWIGDAAPYPGRCRAPRHLPVCQFMPSVA